jgi:hypothetical protein
MCKEQNIINRIIIKRTITSISSSDGQNLLAHVISRRGGGMLALAHRKVRSTCKCNCNTYMYDDTAIHATDKRAVRIILCTNTHTYECVQNAHHRQTTACTRANRPIARCTRQQCLWCLTAHENHFHLQEYSSTVHPHL